MIYEKLSAIQQSLKVPKKRTNTFGNYKYRSLEDILDAVKPLLKENGLTLYMSDEMVCIGQHNYIKAIATLADDKGIITTTAYARESEQKKGMDDSQITGTTSSYARKSCLNAMFLIDDTQDADSDEFAKENENRKKKAEDDAKNEEEMEKDDKTPATDGEKKAFAKLCKSMSLEPSALLAKVGWVEGELATKGQIGRAMHIVKNIEKEREILG